MWFALVTVAVVGATAIFGADVSNEFTPTGCPNYPDSPVMNDEFRNFMLNTINGYRSRVAKGIHPTMSNNGTYFPAGKNINKLSWDCRIEAAGRIASETCQTLYDPSFEIYGYGQVYFWNSSAYESPERAMELLIWTEFRDNVEGLKVHEDGETRLHHPARGWMNDIYETFACWYGSKNCNSEFSWNDPNANTTAICGFSPWGKMWVDENGVTQRPITYTLGSPCSVDSDCTNPNGFTSCDANLGLCTKTPTAPATTSAPYNPCAAGWFFYPLTNSCYRYVNGSTARSQAQAEQWCVNQGKKGHLVSIHNEAENDFVKSMQI
uniref:SCP domain-containing protein n=1 Tax=Panagrolaimus sp. ES5 TaxID=591445 RepID=A0AC34GP62_9BILA